MKKCKHVYSFSVLLGYSCFTMLYYFLLYNKVNQLNVCMYTLPPGPLFHSPLIPAI